MGRLGGASSSNVDSLVDGYLVDLEAELGTLSMSVRGSAAVGSGPLGPTETCLLEVVLFVAPFLLPIAAAIYLELRLRAGNGVEQRPVGLR